MDTKIVGTRQWETYSDDVLALGLFRSPSGGDGDGMVLDLFRSEGGGDGDLMVLGLFRSEGGGELDTKKNENNFKNIHRGNFQ